MDNKKSSALLPIRTWLVVLGLVIAWGLYLALFGPRAPVGGGNLGGPLLEAPSPPLRADYNWTLRDLNDAPVMFSKFQGRPVFLNIWATWCPPCVAELPSIANLADNAALKDVAFVCVATDESAETVRAFVRDKKWSMTILRATEVPAVFTTDGIPATFVIAPDGRIAATEVGSAQWDHPSAVAFLKKLSAPTPAEPPPVKP